MEARQPNRRRGAKVHGTQILAGDNPQRYREKLARITLDSMVQFVGLLDARGTVLEINKVALDAVGITLADVEGQPFWTTFWWQVSDEVRQGLVDAIGRAAQGEFVRWDTPIYGRAGGKETIIIDASLCPVLDEEGKVVFIAAEGRDITEKKAYEEEIARKSADLQALLGRVRELDEIKTQFFANVSHELRTPLALIIGPAQRLLDAAPPPAEQRETAQVIVRNARMLLKHVNDLLDVSRLEAGKLRIELRDADVASLLRFMASHFEVLAAERGVTLQVQAPPTLVAAVDAEKLQRVVMNLLSNAFKFVPAGGQLRCSLRATAGTLQLDVEDSGPGVKPELRKAIFERFRQGDGSANRQVSGTGLGLAIAQEFAALHKGGIEVLDSALGGALFRVALPLARLSVAEPTGGEVQLPDRSTLDGLIEELRAPTPEPAAEELSAQVDAVRASVLVVEDNPDMNRFVAQCLSRDYRVITAFDGRQGLEQALAQQPDLIVTDIMMPGVSGEEMIAALRRHPQTRDTPVLLLSAKADEDLRLRLLEEGAQDFITKPFAERDLLLRVRHLVERQRAERALAEELATTQRLHALGRRINDSGSQQELLEEILDDVVAIQGADFGSVQLWDAASASLRLVGQRGFSPEFARQFAVVHADTHTACGLALQRRERVLIGDVETDASYATCVDVARQAGYRTVQSTPLLSREGRPLGVLSTYFRRPHRLSGHELKLTDLFAAQASAAIERMSAGEALRTTETRLRAALSAGRMASWYWDAATGQATASETLAELYGLPPGEPWRGGEQILSLLHPDDLERHLAAVRGAAGTGGGWHSEYRILRPRDGQTAWLEEWADATTDPQTGKLGMAGLVWDVTDRKRAELRVQEGDVRFRALVQSVRDYAILMLDPSGYVIEWTEGAERVKGYAAADVLGKHFSMFFTPEDIAADAPARELSEATLQGRAERFSWRVRKDGSRFWGHEIATAVRGPAGELLGFTKISRDLTESKRAEEALREADRRKDEFLATLAHELRNPLAPIRNGLQIVRLTGRADPRLQGTVEMMDRQLTHLVRLVDDLLDVGRIASGKLQLRLQPLALADVLASSIEAVRGLIDSHRHELVVEPGGEEVRLSGDFDRLTQVFSNLLSNAAKYSEPGGRICLSVRCEGDKALVRVSDSGVGIPAADLERVFDLFSQVRAHQGRAEGGLGIGLSLVRNLVVLHGGTVVAQSEGPGRGSSFLVRLPLLAASEPREVMELPPPPPATPRLRVLVVDDNVDAANSLAALLEIQGHEAAVAHDGEKGIEKAREFRPDVAILDIGMPRMDGTAAARHLRALPGGDKLLLLALTGLGQSADRERTRAAGFDRHLVKPLNLALLAGILAERAAQATN